MLNVAIESRDHWLYLPHSEETRGGVKCRIPQRLPSNRVKGSYVRTKSQNNENMLQRPKSANRTKDDTMSNRVAHNITSRSTRIDRDNRPPLKRPSTIPKRVINDAANKPRQIITVPIASKAHGRNTSLKNISHLPDQDTIKKCEDLEVCQSPFGYDDLESITSPSDKAMQLKIKWEGKMMQFDSLKNELITRQRDLVEVYATLKSIHGKMSEIGQKSALPPAEELRIMNVANLTPGQLLQLCANSEGKAKDFQNACKAPVAVDVNKLYNIPSKLVSNCEQTLVKRKEIIDWFETLLTQEKGISTRNLSKKINEFNAENNMLHCNLIKIKTEFYEELNEIVEVVRKSMNDTVAMQLKADELMCSLSELNGKNEDLRKQMLNADNLKSQNNKYRIEMFLEIYKISPEMVHYLCEELEEDLAPRTIEGLPVHIKELEKDLKGEKYKNMMLRERLLKAEGQVKMNVERATQLEATLEQARTQTRTLERTVQHLQEQNQKLQDDFEKELNKLTESIKENTAHLEEIADTREKLQVEKGQLEKRIEDLSTYYNESLENLKSEMNTNVLKLIESDEKYQAEVNEKKKLEDKISSLCSQLIESELKCKDLQKHMQEKDNLSCKYEVCQKELEKARYDLNITEHEIDDFKSRLSKQSEQIQELEKKCKDGNELQERLKSDLIFKANCVKELEKTALQLEQQLHDSKSKIISYEEELTALRNQLNRLQEDFGDFEHINDLLEMVSQQKEKLIDTSRQNEELIGLLQNKDLQLERQAAELSQKEMQLEKENDVIKMMSNKDDEQANIIKLLRNSLELRSHADSELQQKLVEKNTEIDKLITSLETRKQQIAEFEKIIMTLEEQTRKANIEISNLETIVLSLEEQSRKDNLQKRKDQERMALMESKLHEYESFYTNEKQQQDTETPSDNLDNLIKILENELGMPLETHTSLHDKEYNMKHRNFIGEHKQRDKQRVDGEPPLYSDPGPKSVIRNFGMHCLTSNDENYAGDSLDRKKAITNMDMQKVHIPETGLKTNGTFSNKGVPAMCPKKNIASRNLGIFSPDKLQEDKKYKMFKLAGHRL